MVRPDDYVPPQARAALPEPTAWQRFRDRYGNRLLATSFVSAGVAVWTVAVAGRGAHPRWGMCAGAFVTLGLFAAVRPAWGFTFGERWTYREEPEPSRAYLVFTRVSGVVMLILGLVLGLATDGPSYDEGSDGTSGVVRHLADKDVPGPGCEHLTGHILRCSLGPAVRADVR